VCQVESLCIAGQVWTFGSAEEQPVWLQLLLFEAVQAGIQFLSVGAESAGLAPIGPANFELAWTVQKFATVAPDQVVRARKRLILAGAALHFPLQPYFAESVLREHPAVGPAARCLIQPAVQQTPYFGSLQGCLTQVGPVPGEQGVTGPPVKAPAMIAESVSAAPARISMLPRLLLPAVPGGNPTAQIRARPVAPGSVGPARI
jgi:hypothetical protein